MNALKIVGNKIYCYDPKYEKYRKMGERNGDTFIKSVEEKHYMVRKQGYGLQLDALQLFEKNGMTKIAVYEAHTGDKYTISVAKWLEHKDYADYGLGKQAFMPRALMDKQT